MKSLVAILLALCLFGALFGASSAHADGMADEAATATPEELAAVRVQMDLIFDGFEDLGTQCGLTHVLPYVENGRAEGTICID